MSAQLLTVAACQCSSEHSTERDMGLVTSPATTHPAWTSTVYAISCPLDKVS